MMHAGDVPAEVAEVVTSVRSDSPSLSDLLSALHPVGYRDLRALNTGGQAKTRRAPVSDWRGVESFVEAHADCNLYVGVAPRRSANGRKLADCLPLHALFADIDFKTFAGGEPEARQRLAEFPLAPSAVVASGGGLYAYYFLTAPLAAQSPEATSLLRRLCAAVGGDLSAAEPARILRIPGTLNFKYDPPRPVVLESLSGARYPLAQIEAVLPELPEGDTGTFEIDPPNSRPVEHGLSVEARKRFARRWLESQPGGYRQGYRPDDPEQFGHDELIKVLKTVSNDFDLLDLDAVLDALTDWNQRCDPSWPRELLKEEARGVLKRAGSAKRRRGAALQWARRRDRNGADKGIDASALHNVRLALAKLGVDLFYDAFAENTFVDRRTLEDPVVDDLWVRIDDRFRFRPEKPLLRTVLETEARGRTVHPVLEYLDSLHWDGKARLDTWLIDYGGAEDSPYVRAVGRLVLLAAVRRVRQPGAKFDEMLMLESAQGMAKSEAVKTLCPDPAWFADSIPLNASSQVLIEQTEGKWIIEVPELHGYSQGDVDKLKATLSRSTDRARLAYGHYVTERRRQFVFIGTTNQMTDYLKDSTGNRRFWPVRVVRFDLPALRRDRDQLWAEAVVRERRDESIRLPEELWAAAAREQEKRQIVDPWEERLIERTNVEDPEVNAVESDLIWEVLDSLHVNQRNPQHAQRVSKTMQRLGFVAKKRVWMTKVVKDFVPDGELKTKQVEREERVRPHCWLKPDVVKDDVVVAEKLKFATYVGDTGAVPVGSTDGIGEHLLPFVGRRGPASD
ncbi:MAG TPA: VapE domain-containing protein [Vicinamibacterales bacterium]|nr:VapE domain-containing protein [Vicinamibacterales bacterium]